MFEDATFHSGNTLHTQTPRWLPVAIAVNLFMLAAMMAKPLIFPEGIPQNLLSNLMYIPSPPPAVRHEESLTTVAVASRPMIAPTTVPTQPPVIQHTRSNGEDLPPTIGTTLAGSNDGIESGEPGAVSTDVFRSATTPLPVKPATVHSVHLTSTMTAGLLVSKTTPIYPSIAKATGTSGTVVLAATISTTGSIENLRVLSGSPMLTRAAIDAVQTWRYRPYLLNHQPVEVETTINVVFSLGGR
jgi:protein TonB